jgi:hypothetical protein
VAQGEGREFKPQHRTAPHRTTPHTHTKKELKASLDYMTRPSKKKKKHNRNKTKRGLLCFKKKLRLYLENTQHKKG